MPRLDPDQIDLQIEAKLTRQRILTRDDPPRFDVVLDEAALHRMVGGRQVMAAQLTKILDIVGLAERCRADSSVRIAALTRRWRATSPSWNYLIRPLV